MDARLSRFSESTSASAQSENESNIPLGPPSLPSSASGVPVDLIVGRPLFTPSNAPMPGPIPTTGPLDSLGSLSIALPAPNAGASSLISPAASGLPSILTHTLANPPPSASSECPVYVMLPLDTVTKEAGFKYATSRWFNDALKQLKYAGVHGVAVDIWWGVVEPEARRYDFSGYRRLAEVVDSFGLRLQCVLSFHACGSCVGDEVSVPLPAWVLEMGQSDPDLFFCDGSEHISSGRLPVPPHPPSEAATTLGFEGTAVEGNRGRVRSSGFIGPQQEEAPLQAEYLSIWADEDPAALGGRSPVQAYYELSRAFAEEFRPLLGSVIDEVVVGLGPSGELRYPSHQVLKGWSFPGVGRFQCFDRRAVASLQEAASRRGRPAWGAPVPVKDCGDYASAPEATAFFGDAEAGWDSEQGRFFLEWYSQSLIDHGDRVLKAVLSGLRGDASSPAHATHGEHPLYALLRNSYHLLATRRQGPTAGGSSGAGRLIKAPSLEALFPILPSASSLQSLEEFEGEGEGALHRRPARTSSSGQPTLAAPADPPARAPHLPEFPDRSDSARASPSHSWLEPTQSMPSAGPRFHLGSSGRLSREFPRAAQATSYERLDELDRERAHARSGQPSPGPGASGYGPGSPSTSMPVDPDTMEQIKLHMRNTFRSSLSRRGSTASLDKMRTSAGPQPLGSTDAGAAAAPVPSAATASRPSSLTLPQPGLGLIQPLGGGLGDHLRRALGAPLGLKNADRKSWAGALNSAGAAASPASAGSGTSGEAPGPPSQVGAVRVSIKIAGIHWLYGTRAHAAELTSGYYNVQGRDGYRPLAELAARHAVGLTFTCMEMHRDQHPAPARSDCDALVDQVRRACAVVGVPLSGENALALFSASGADVQALRRIEQRAGPQPLAQPLQLAPQPPFSGRAAGGPRRSLNLETTGESANATSSKPASDSALSMDGVATVVPRPGGGKGEENAAAAGRAPHTRSSQSAALSPPQVFELPPLSAFTFLRLTSEMLNGNNTVVFAHWVGGMKRIGL